MRNTHKFIFLLFIATSVIFSSCTKNEVTKITIDKSDLNLILGQVDSLYTNVEFTGDIKPATTWTSSQQDVAKVTNGEIQALKKGSAVITAQAGSKSATCSVEVGNEILPVLTKGEIWYYGDVYDSGTSNNFLVCLAGPDINMENLSGNDDIVFLEFNTDLSIKTQIPTGIYEISDSFQPGTMVPGWVEDNGNPWGTWYFGITYNDAVDGFVNVTNNNNGNYSFELHLTDYFGNSITGIYQMNLTFFDFSEETMPQVKVNQKIKSYQLSNRTKISTRKSFKR